MVSPDSRAHRARRQAETPLNALCRFPEPALSPQASGSRLVQLQEAERLQALKASRESRNKLKTLYPNDGPLRRELYAKFLEFFAAGATCQERCLMAANRVGKTW